MTCRHFAAMGGPQQGLTLCLLAFATYSLMVSFYLNDGQPRTLLQLKLVGILTINLFLT
jgi:hypothetical protein